MAFFSSSLDATTPVALPAYPPTGFIIPELIATGFSGTPDTGTDDPPDFAAPDPPDIGSISKVPPMDPLGFGDPGSITPPIDIPEPFGTPLTPARFFPIFWPS